MTLSPHSQRERTDGAGLRHEQRIVWLEDIDALDYVRETVVRVPFRARRPGRGRFPGRLVGYTVLRADAPAWSPGIFERRVFWLAAHDRDSGDAYTPPGAPIEAVDPRSVSPGVCGELTERAWGGLTASAP